MITTYSISSLSLCSLLSIASQLRIDADAAEAAWIASGAKGMSTDEMSHEQFEAWLAMSNAVQELDDYVVGCLPGHQHLRP